jgi:cytochrome c
VVHLLIRDKTKQTTPLYQAVRGGHPQVVAYLIQKGADVNLGDKTQKTPLHIAARYEVQISLSENNNNNNNNNNNDRKIKNGTHYFSISSKIKGVVECVPLLLEVSAIDVNREDYSNRTPLHLCCAYGEVETLKRLLAHPNIQVNSTFHLKNKRIFNDITHRTH